MMFFNVIVLIPHAIPQALLNFWLAFNFSILNSGMLNADCRLAVLSLYETMTILITFKWLPLQTTKSKCEEKRNKRIKKLYFSAFIRFLRHKK